MAASIRDVAEQAGVSASTVSRAFSRPEKVDPATLRRVLDLAERIGYQPSGAARSLKTGRTGALGIMVPDLSNPFFPDLVQGAQHRARAHGYAVLLVDSGEDPAIELSLVRSLARNVDALVLCAPRMTDAELDEAALLRPLVLVNRDATGAAAATAPVTIDNAGGVRQAVRHLLALGHTRIGYVSGTTASRSNQQRIESFVAETSAAGFSGHLVGEYPPTIDGGAAAADDTLLADVTAVLVYNDIMAVGLMGRLAHLGIELPARLSIVGFDGISLSGLVTPALTTVRVPLGLAGAVAVDRLHAHLDGALTDDEPPAPLSTELVVRASTAVLSLG